MAIRSSSEPEVRLAELLLAISLATDLGLGQPMNHALRSARIAVDLGRAVGLGDEELSDCYYLALLMFVGCSSVAVPVQRVFGDELRARGFLAPVFLADFSEMMAAIQKNVGGEGPPEEREARVSAVIAAMPQLQGTGAEQCEVAQMLARSFGVSPVVERGLGQVFEMWNGQGVPRGLAGDRIERAVQIVQLAHAAEYFAHQGIDAVVAMARRRAGVAHAPDLVDELCKRAPAVLAGIDQVGWNEALACEPLPHKLARGPAIDRILEVAADFVDLKSPFFVTHSRGVAKLAEAAARTCDLPEDDVTCVRRAALVHDLGKAGVSVGIWDKRAPLTDPEWERVRMHAYLTERMFARVAGVPHLASLAACDHERADGSGYPRGSLGAASTLGARIIAAADVYHALTEPRPHREAFTPDAAEREVLSEVRRGKLDGEAVRAVLRAAGRGGRATKRRGWPAGLSEREVEVLRLVARGLSNKEMAAALAISAATIDHHLRHIYDKLSVSTRAAATVFAMQNALLSSSIDATD